jgi:phosphate-selective porin OprO/OprP
MKTKKIMMIFVLAVAAGAGAQAADPSVAEQQAEPSVCDKVWSYAELYKNKDAAVVQNLQLTGRVQGDAYYVDSEDHGNSQDIDWRRFRFGAKATLFQDFLLHVEADLDPNNIDNGDVYKGLTDAYIAWSRSKALKLKVGKQSAGFTLDGATSSKELLTLERSIVAENLWFTSEYFTGVAVSGKSKGWSYNLGGFSSEGDEEFGRFDSGWFGLASVGRDVTENVNLRLDYVHNEPDYSGEVDTKKLTDILSAVSRSEFGRFGLRTDLSYALGDDDAGQSDLVGLQVMPYWNFTEMWQGVASYAMVHSTEGPGATLGRYPRRNLSDSKYEDIQNVYLGLNCYLYGHKLKWQTGVEYSLAQNDSAGGDYNGWGVTSGLRLSW